MLFIAMRFVRGGDLRLVLEREGALAPARAAAFISPVASALDAVHDVGLVQGTSTWRTSWWMRVRGGPIMCICRIRGEKRATASVSLTGTGQFR